MRSVGLSVLSLALTTIVIGNAYYQKKQFYPSVVYLTKSNPSLAVIYIQAFICVLILGKIMRRIFFGQLRSAEFEHLMERSWYAITETCLAFTVFRDDFNPKFVALFTLLLFLKSFHWLAEDRVDYMERSPVISLIFHIRVLSLLLLLGSMDLHFIQHAYQSTMAKGASVQLVFGFEYAILLTIVINIAIKYALHFVDLNSESPWDNKAVFLLYTELVMGFVKVVLYLAFVVIMVRIYTLPLFAFRPMYYAIRNFKKAFSDVILSRRAIHNMNTLYPDATADELQAADNVCIICREEMTGASKKLPCNHIFHTSCLRSWFQRQQTCPTCRLNILRVPQQDTTTPPGGGNVNQQPQLRVHLPHQQQPQQQQQQQQQQQAFFNGQNPFAMFAQHMQQQQQQQQQQPGGPPPPFVFPPFPFVPFVPPPPPPPPQQQQQNMHSLPRQPLELRALSDEELRRMEGRERENVEARIECLRHIQGLLDAAVLMMQQYSASAALSAQLSGASTATAQPPTASEQAPSAGDSAAGPSGTSPKCNGTKTATEEPSSASGEAKETTEERNEIENADTQSGSVTAEEVLRRRRLQRFEQAEQR